MKLFELYKQWMETGTMGQPKVMGGGLCNMLPTEYKYDDLEMMKPTMHDLAKINSWGTTFWAYGENIPIDLTRQAYDFTPLRQNIVLFICAMNDEL